MHGARRARHHRGMRCKSKRATAGGDKIGGRSSSRRQPLLTPALSSPGRRGGVEGAATFSLLPVAVEVTLALSTTFPLRLRGRGTGGGGTFCVRAAVGTAVAGGRCPSQGIPLVPLDPGESRLSQLIPLDPEESPASHLIPLDPGESRLSQLIPLDPGGSRLSHLIPLNPGESRESQLIPLNPRESRAEFGRFVPLARAA